ncbi:MAG TPA: glycosyltransferase family 2 protein [Thermoleophilaceae bacterium]|nr:glycosyltransferase family 2 protein [Thermoleophilaceae bacterium]
MIIAHVLQAIFWICIGLLVYTHAGYPLLLASLTRIRRGGPTPSADRVTTPPVSLVIAAYNEGAVIERKVANARALDYPDLEVIVASDGSTDDTASTAKAAGADCVLELPRGGKVRAQDTAVETARGEIVAFSDANSFWHPDALRRLVAPFADPNVGYVCGQVRFTNDDGDNQEGLYWRYEMWIRGMESRLAGVTGGNGAIYAVRRESYIHVDPRMGHDLSFPFNMVKRGWKPVYARDARAEEKMVPSIEGEFRRKRRMQSHMWPIVLSGGLLGLRGYSPLYALEVYSHRVLRYLTPLLHLIAFGVNIALLDDGLVYVVTFAAQVALLGGAIVPAGPLRPARYYVAMTAAIGLAFFDWLRTGTPAGWEQAEGTR